MKSLTILVLGLLAFPAIAELPPYHQRTTELTRMFEEDKLETELKAMPIVNIQRKGDAFTVMSDDSYEQCHVTVTVSYKDPEPGVIGPKQFDLQVGEGRCRTYRRRP